MLECQRHFVKNSEISRVFTDFFRNEAGHYNFFELGAVQKPLDTALQNAPLGAKIGFDTAENGASKVSVTATYLHTTAYRHKIPPGPQNGISPELLGATESSVSVPSAALKRRPPAVRKVGPLRSHGSPPT